MGMHSRNRLVTRLASLFLFAGFAVAAIAQSVIVLPPYSAKLSDYTQKPGKIQVFILASSSVGSPTINVYVQGKIASFNGNIEISTKPGSKASGIIALPMNTLRMLTAAEISAIFNDQTLVYKGITRTEVLKNGLPEGSYQFCFTVYQSSDGAVIAPEICSAPFSFSAVEPPMIIQPQNNTNVPSQLPQNILFQWTMPPQAPLGTKYTLKILEMDKPDRNPDEAFNATGYPVFFETTVLSPLYMYTVASPILVKGKKYAFRVTAVSPAASAGPTRSAPTETSIFKNNGNSEVYSFTYTQQSNVTGGPGSDISMSQNKLSILVPIRSHPDSSVYVSAYTNFYLRWTLNDTTGYGEKKYGKSAVIQYIGGNKDTLTPLTAKYRMDFFSLSDNPTLSFHKEYCDARKPFLDISEKTSDGFLKENKSYAFIVTLFDTVSLVTLAESEPFKFKYARKKETKTIYSQVKGTLKYQFEGEAESYTIPNASIRLKTIYHLKTKDGQDLEIDKNTSGFADLLFQNKLFTDKTDGSGKFKLAFAFADGTKFGAIDTAFSTTLNGKTIAGTLYYAVRLSVESPYYYQPEQDIIISKTDTTDAGVITAFVKGYSLKAFITQGYSATTQVTEQVIGKTIYLYRINKSLPTPVNEGTKAMVGFNPGGMFDYCTLIGEEKAIADKDKDGKNTASVSFTRLVASKIPGDEYYMLIKGANYKTAQKISFDIEKKESGFLDSIKILAPATGFNSAQFGGSYINGMNSIETTTEIDPWITYTSFGSGPNPIVTGAGSKGHGESHVMSLQTSGNHHSTSADNTYTAMAGTNFVVQSFVGLGNNNNSYKALPNDGLFNALEALADYPIIKKDGKYSFSVKTAYRIITDQYPKSKIKGKLTYTWAGKPGFSKPLSNRQITLVECLVTDDVPGKTKALLHETSQYSRYLIATTIKSGKTKSDGSFDIEFNNTYLDYGKPYTNPKNSEKGPYVYYSGTSFTTTKQSSAYHSTVSTIRSPYSGTVKKVLRILIEDWSNDYYVGTNLSPENDFIINPLDSLDVGTITSKVVSVGTTGKLKGTLGGSYPPQSIGVLSGIECYLLRKNSSYIFPEGEGNSEKITGHLDEFPDYTIIDKTESASDGAFSFHNYLALSLSNDFNMFYFKSKDLSGTSNFKPYTIPLWLVVQEGIGLHQFNNEFDYTEGPIDDIFMTVGSPIVKGKVVSDINAIAGVDGATCKIDLYSNGNSIYWQIKSSHDGGYFELPLEEWFVSSINHTAKGWSTIDSTVLTITKPKFGYKDNNGVWHGAWRRQYGKDLLKPGTQIVEPSVLLAAAGSLKGEVICKVGHTIKYIPSYLQFIEKNTNNTDGLKSSLNLFDDGKFQNPGIPAIPGNHKLVVIPVDPAYFPDTIPVTVNNGTPTNIQVEVFERLHRVKFLVKSKIKAGSIYAIMPLKGAVIELCDGQGTSTSDSIGQVILKFKNVSVDNLTMKITGPQGGNYIPKYVTFKNIETDSMVVLPEVRLEKGISLTGKVTLNLAPTSDARVYADVSCMTGLDAYSDSSYKSVSKSIFEADVLSDGSFTFNTLPPEVSGSVLPVFAVYKPPFDPLKKQSKPDTKTIIGDLKLVSMPASQPVLMNLTVLDNVRMNTLWGFPMQPFKIQQTAWQQIQIMGNGSILKDTVQALTLLMKRTSSSGFRMWRWD